MPRLASLFLPDLAIDRIGRGRSEGPHRPDAPAHPAPALPNRGEGARGVKSGHWRPGARWAREAAPQPAAAHEGAGALVTVQRVGNRMLLAALCGRARALGLEPGMPLSEARLLAAGLDVRPADPEGDSAFLARLGLFAARRWTPRAALSGPDGLWLDLTGVAHLFGGEEPMGRRILAFCARLGFSARLAVAGSAGAAHALARFGGAPLILCPAGGEADSLAAMPLAALRLDDGARIAAIRLGLDRIGELIGMPRAPLYRRLGADALLRLDQALGRAAEPFDPIVPVEPPAVTLSFLEPIATAEAIAEASGEAVRRLVPRLAEAGLAVRRLALAFERVDRVGQWLTLGLARATRDGDHLLRLIRAKIEEIEPGLGIERLRLTAVRVEPLAPRPVAGALAGAPAEPDLALLVDRLAVRLGARRIHRLSALESDLPERSVERVAPLAAAAPWPSWPRPVRLLSPPEPVDHVMSDLPDGPPRRFIWRGRRHEVAAADGPERIYGEWWRHGAERAAVRDYFQVEDQDGARFWLFRRGDGEDPATGDLGWHLHGLFG